MFKPELIDGGNGVTSGLGGGHRNASFCFGRGRPIASGNNECTVDQSIPPLVPIANSTPAANAHSQPTQVVTHEALSGILTDLVKQIGDNITASLSSMHQPSHGQLPPSAESVSPSRLESSQLKVVVQSEAKAPPFFRGDHSDMFSIQECVRG